MVIFILNPGLVVLPYELNSSQRQLDGDVREMDSVPHALESKEKKSERE